MVETVYNIINLVFSWFSIVRESVLPLSRHRFRFLIIVSVATFSIAGQFLSILRALLLP